MRNKRFFTKTTAIALSAMMMAGCAGTSTTTPTSEAVRIESTIDASTSETEESSAFEQESEDISTEEKTTLYEETEEPSSEDESLEETEDASEEESKSSETEEATTLSKESESVTEEPTAEESEEEPTVPTTEETTPVPTTTAEPTTPVPTTVEPTTEKQTTVAPTEPTTPEPTTAEPTTPEETTPAPETKPAVKAVKVEGSVNGTHYVGDTLGASDFTIKVTMSDGTVLTNPNGFAVSPLSITQKDMTFACAYADVSSTFTYTAQEKTTPSNPQPSVTGATATTSSIGLTTKDVCVKRAIMIVNAINLIGTPYVLGGTSTNGFDCSGFVWYVYKQMGINIPRSAKEQATCGYIMDCTQAQRGDIFVYEYKDGTYHTGIWIGNDVVIDAMENLGVMRREALRTDFYNVGGYNTLKAYYCVRVPQFANLINGKTSYSFGDGLDYGSDGFPIIGSEPTVAYPAISFDAVKNALYYTYVTLNGMDAGEFNSWVERIKNGTDEGTSMNSSDPNMWLLSAVMAKFWISNCPARCYETYQTPTDCWTPEGKPNWQTVFSNIQFPRYQF